MSHSEADLKALTVVKLKELLAARSLPVTGKKDELIARLLSNSDAPLTADSTGPTSATDEPDGTGLSGTAEASAAATGESERSAGQTGEALGQGAAADEAAAGGEAATDSATTNGDAAPAAPAPTAEEAAAAQAQVDADKVAAARLEEDKRAARAARFGNAAPSAEAAAPKEGDESVEAKKKRAERFGLEVDAGNKDVKGDDKLNKSLAALDAPLGSNKRQREPKKPLATYKTNPQGEKSVAGAAAETKGGKVDAKSAAAEPAAAVAADPELKKKLEEEEEKKRKRAARFGPPAAEEPQEKKAKVDA
ncbi:hypothetical protein JCM3775_001916 [Rhodotorula graminis]|uniref:SAP domain-containing protein n=1 Tax=Rhodotorula graminis (strain WP1) TaxID=578459 RepID=A0A0P9EJ88_RHOGW|nr:uncharacterized protein RHOBADRAFT_47427 [Rhodotorula graminis WP1]KPV71723.1 hypothetical protein RHOBADRAFT_47427 [Rhodotorula graminis WP1]